jgi:hypothetical protein
MGILSLLGFLGEGKALKRMPKKKAEKEAGQNRIYVLIFKQARTFILI